MSQHRFTFTLLLAAFLVTTPLFAQKVQQGLPRFQTTVDVTSVVDVAVVDGNGQPITGLGPADFIVKIDGNTRRVIDAEWVATVDNAKALAAAVSVPEGYTSNENSGGGRLIVMAFDQAGMRFGGSTAIMKAMTSFIDKLLPSDRVAVVGFEPGAPPLTFVADLERAKQAISRMNGQQPPAVPTTYNIGLAEAMEILHGELGRLDGVIARECVNLPKASPAYSQCSSQVRDEASQLARDAQQQADVTISGLSNLFKSLRAIDAPKVVVLISEGFVVDDSQTFAAQFGAMAGAAQATLYVLHLNDQFFDTTAVRRAAPSIEDRRVRVQGLEALAVAARGSLFTVGGSGSTFFDRIQSEISGYYLVGIAPDARDHDGKVHSIRIDVPWKGAVVRARRQFLNATPSTNGGTPQQMVVTGLGSPLPMSALPIRVATFALQGVEPGKVQMLIHADVGHDYSAAKRVALGYTILDPSGQAVETRRLDTRLPPVMNGVPSALQFAAGASLLPGEYTLKLVAADGDRVGSVEHRFQAKLSEASGVKLSELMVGGPTAVSELLTPTIGYGVNFGSVHGYLEAYGPQSEAVTVKYEIAATSTAGALLTAPVAGRLFGDDRMIFSLVMPVMQLPPGPYVLRAMVSLAAKPLKTLTRPFEIAAPAVLMASASGAPSADTDVEADLFLPVDEQAFVRPFLRDDALKPDVLKPFRDRVAPAARVAFEAGVTSLAAGDYAKAEASFKSGVQPDIDSTPLLAYLAVIYAAIKDDVEAASAWQTALVDGADIPQLYVWLSQVLLRTRSLPEARDILEEANGKWPSDARFTAPLAAVYATFGKGREAVRLLEQHLESSPGDVEAARVGVEWMYQVHAAGKSVHSRAEDVKLAQSWASLYGNGPQQALVRQWLDVLERETR